MEIKITQFPGGFRLHRLDTITGDLVVYIAAHKFEY